MKGKLCISVHLCFLRNQKLKKHCSILLFALKNQSESKKTQRLHTVLSKKENDRLIIEEETSETGLGFVDKFVSLFMLRNKLEKARSEIKAKKLEKFLPACLG